ncbi:CoA-binding protein [Candidatus Pyrohabitans sp.]
MSEPGDDEIRELLQNARTIAVVGFSTNPAKDAYQVPKKLMELGYRVIPVNPFAEEILGERCYPSLREIPREVKVDIVNVFRPAQEVPDIVEQAIEIGARAVWLQLGITHEAAAKRAREAGLKFIQNRCIKAEHLRLFGK